MEFREKQAIFLQIAEYVSDQILLKKWESGNRILSIRELAILMQVTPNTIQRTYDFLQGKNIISNKRGIGYFVEDQAIERVMIFRREQFIENELPTFLRNMYLLKIYPEEIAKQFDAYILKFNNYNRS
ncbi:GntR family transcriptional regulator [Pedobacter sp. UYP24]